MPRFFFSLANGGREPDDTGVDLPDVAAARIEAVAYAGELLKSNPRQLWKQGQWRVEVTNAERALLCTVVILAFDSPAAIEGDL